MHEAIAVSVSQCTYLSVIIYDVYNNLIFAYDLNRTCHGVDITYTIFQIKIHTWSFINFLSCNSPFVLVSIETGGYYIIGSKCSVNPYTTLDNFISILFLLYSYILRPNNCHIVCTSLAWCTAQFTYTKLFYVGHCQCDMYR